ncbi:MAG TPA: glutaredoxin family protein [Candidatus Limnocylindrales bacterium]
MAPLPDLVLYTRPGCELCDETRDMLTALLAQRSAAGQPTPAIREQNIEDDDDLHRRYLAVIPVIVIGDLRLELATSVGKVRRLLADALDAPGVAIP